MRGDVLILWSLLFDVYQFAFLLVVTDSVLTSELFASFFVIVAGMTPDGHLVSITAFLQSRIVQLAAPGQGPLQFFGCGFVRVDAILVGFDAHGCCYSRLWGNEYHTRFPLSVSLLSHLLQNGHPLLCQVTPEGLRGILHKCFHHSLLVIACL